GHVAVHVVEAPGIGLLLTYRMGLLVRVVREPTIFTELARVAAERVIRVGAGSTGVFPLCLRRQPVAVGLKVARRRVLVITRRQPLGFGASVAIEGGLDPSDLPH